MPPSMKPKHGVAGDLQDRVAADGDERKVTAEALPCVGERRLTAVSTRRAGWSSCAAFGHSGSSRMRRRASSSPTVKYAICRRLHPACNGSGKSTTIKTELGLVKPALRAGGVRG